MPKSAKKSRSRRGQHQEILSGGDDRRHLYPSQPEKLKKLKREAPPPTTPYSEEPKLIPGFNLAGRPSRAEAFIGGIIHSEHKIAKPIISGDLNTTSYWLFKIKTSNREWFRFNVDSLSMILFGQYANPSRDANSSDAEKAAEKHAFRAIHNKPDIWLDPSVYGTTFISSVDVNINNVPVASNANLNNFLTQYTRFSNIFRQYPAPFFAHSGEMTIHQNEMPSQLAYAKKLLEYGAYNATEGLRLPIYLNGIFPFEYTCQSRASLIKHANKNLFFPPGTSVEIRVNLHPNKNKLFFHDAHLPLATKYYSTDVAVINTELELTVQDVSLTYETYVLDEKNHLSAMSEFHKGLSGKYDYDIVYPMHQSITSNQSYVHNEFQIPSYCSMLCIMFLPDHALFATPSQKKPTSGLSQFPRNCIKMKLRFNGIPLICDEIENIGIANNHNELSKKILYNYLIDRRIYNGPYSAYFPPSNLTAATQMFVLDMENTQSPLTGTLSIESFYNAQKSPAGQQILIFSIHANGRGEVKLLNKLDYNYEWKFYTTTPL